jgi:hypothetical protein
MDTSSIEPAPKAGNHLRAHFSDSRERHQVEALPSGSLPDASGGGKPKRRPRRINGPAGQRSNFFRLSDIAKVIRGRHGGPCDDLRRMKLYFRAALPHVLASKERIIAAGGNWLAAVHAWVAEWVPTLPTIMGPGWIERQARACYAKPRRCPRIDRTSNLMEIEDHEPVAFSLRSLPAVSRPKKVREAERAVKSAARSRKHRAKVEGYKPRSESLAQTKPWAAEGISRSEWYARRKREQEAILPAVLDGFERTDNDAPDGFERNMIGGPSGRFRTQHLDIPGTPSAALLEETRNEADGPVPGGAGSALERSPATLTEAAAEGGREARGAPRPRKRIPNPVQDLALARPPLGPISSCVLKPFRMRDADVTARSEAPRARPGGRGVLVMAAEDRIELPEPVPIWPVEIACRNGAAGGHDAQR